MIAGRSLVEGLAEGPVLVAPDPISFWGGVDPETGRIIEKRNAAFGETLKGRVLLLRAVKGSSSGSSILAETLRNGTGPVAIVLGAPDAILPAGAMVANRLYGVVCPIVCVVPDDWQALRTCTGLKVEAVADQASVVLA